MDKAQLWRVLFSPYTMQPGESPKIPYKEKQPPLGISEQLDLLAGKGLVIQDRPLAEKWLSHISYFRFKQYSYSFKDYHTADGNYFKDTTFEMVRDLYQFDKKLRMIVFEALEAIEVSIKTTISNIMSGANGTHWYEDAALFLSEEDRRNILKNLRPDEGVPKLFDHAEFMKDIERTMDNPSQSYLQTYKKFYAPKHPPSWMMMEITTFGTLSMMFENLKPSDQKNKICETYQLPKKNLVSWLHSFSFVRNKCAHHNRLVYSKINFAPSMPKKKSRQFLAEADDLYHDTLYAVLSCMQYMLRKCSPDNEFLINIRNLVNQNPHIDYQRLGFTQGWLAEELWQIK